MQRLFQTYNSTSPSCCSNSNFILGTVFTIFPTAIAPLSSLAIERYLNGQKRRWFGLWACAVRLLPLLAPSQSQIQSPMFLLDCRSCFLLIYSHRFFAPIHNLPPAFSANLLVHYLPLATRQLRLQTTGKGTTRRRIYVSINIWAILQSNTANQILSKKPAICLPHKARCLTCLWVPHRRELTLSTAVRGAFRNLGNLHM